MLVGAHPDSPVTLTVTLKEGEGEVLPVSLGRTHQVMNKARRSNIMVHTNKPHQAKVNIMVQLLYPPMRVMDTESGLWFNQPEYL